VGRKYYFFGETQAGVGWEKHAWKTHQEGVNREGADETPTETQTIGGISRIRHKDAAIGLDSVDVHMSGDPCVVTAEIPDGKGTVVQYVERYSAGGRFLGSYAVPWHKEADGCLVSEKPRRIYY
jgi:hypothetical protein